MVLPDPACFIGLYIKIQYYLSFLKYKLLYIYTSNIYNPSIYKYNCILLQSWHSGVREFKAKYIIGDPAKLDISTSGGSL